MVLSETTRQLAPAAGGLPHEDRALVEGALRGQPAHFEALMRKYNRRLYRSILSVIGDEGQTEDLMQQTYLEAFVHLVQYEGRAGFGAWLLRIALNQAFAHKRRKRRSMQASEAALAESQSQDNPLRNAVAKQEIRLLEQAVLALPAIYRAVYVLREVEQLTTPEAAESLGLTIETVKIRLHRARDGE